MHSILRQQEAQFVAVGGCGCQPQALLMLSWRYATSSWRDGLGRSHLNLATCYPPQDLGGNREQHS